ncbi:MAG: response regulator [Pseudomonadota bacterium]
MKIMIIDNEIEICNRLQRELRKEGHEVEYTTSPLTVIEELKKSRRDGEMYPLLLLNIEMPGMDGLTLLRHIREEFLSVEVIIMTGYREEQTVIKAMRLLAGNYITKPISLEKLNAIISDLMNRAADMSNINQEYRILVVDNEKDLCRRIKRELDKEGYQTAVTYTGKGCVDYFKKNRVDVLIADVKMPGMSGFEVLARCRKIADDFVSIIITGHGDYDTAIAALKLQAFDYLKKPLSLDGLIISVKKGVRHLNAIRGISILKERRDESTNRR